MRKGFDLRLAGAMKIDRQMLFTGWRWMNPEDAPIIEGAESSQADLADAAKRKSIALLLPMADADALDKIEQILLKSQDRLADHYIQNMKGPRRPDAESK